MIEALESKCLLAAIPWRWAGEADPTFRQTIGGQSDSRFDVDVTSDGNVVVTGERDRVSRIYMYLPNGNPNPVFGGGQVSINFGPNLESMSQIRALPGGKVLVAGGADDVPSVPGTHRAAIFAVLNSDGTLDGTFGTGGIAALNFGNNLGDFSAMGVQSSGRILALCNNSLLCAVTSAGIKDTTFGSGGSLSLWGTQSSTTRDLVVLPDDSFFVVGERWSAAGDSSISRIAKFSPDGRPDLSFGTAGVLEIALSAGGWESVRAAGLDANGNLVVALRAGPFSFGQFELQRYLANGVLDLSFGSSGSTSLTAYVSEIADIAFDSVQRIIISGVSRQKTDLAVGGVLRFAPNGQFDSTFGVGGRAIDASIDDQIAIEPDGDIVGIHSAHQTPIVARILGSTRGDGPVYLAPNGDLSITGTPIADQLSLVVLGADLQITLNSNVTTIPLTEIASLTADTRNGTDTIIYDVGDAFAGVTNTLDAGQTSLRFPAPGANLIDVRSGPADGSLFIVAGEGNYSNIITIQGTASLNVTASDHVDLYGTPGDDVFQFTSTLTIGAGSTVHAHVYEIDGAGGNDLFVLRGSNSGPFVRGNDGDDTLDIAGTDANFDGGAGTDQIRLAPSTLSGFHDGWVSPTSASIGTTKVNWFSGVELVHVDGGTGYDSMNLRGTAPQCTVEFNLSDGNDTVTVSGSLAADLTEISANLMLDLGAGDDALLFDDSTATRPGRFSVSQNSLTSDDGKLFASSGIGVSYTGAELITVRSSPLADVAYVIPSATTAFRLSDTSPTLWPGDELRLPSNQIASASVDLTSATSGTIKITGSLPIDFTGIEQLPAFSVNVALSQARYLYDQAIPSLQLVFSFDVASTLQPSDIILTNLSTGANFSPTAATMVYTAATRTAEVRLSAFKLPASDGEYRLRIDNTSLAGPDGNTLSGDIVTDFFLLSGDANRDRKIDATDLGVLSANWQGTSKTFSQGDFNYDGKVDIQDLYILSSKWQQTLAPPALPTSTVTPARRTPTRVAASVLT